MKTYVSDIAFSPAVKKYQEQEGSRFSYQRMAEQKDWNTTVDPVVEEFIAKQDSFYMASANADGQPYIQHRGGPAGFLKVLDEHTLGFADYGGNRQYITAGNLSENEKIQLFLMDYPNRVRIKIWGTAKVSQDKKVIEKLMDETYRARPERAILIHVEAWDVNCPKHITPRFTEAQIAKQTESLNQRIQELEAELKTLKNQ